MKKIGLLGLLAVSATTTPTLAINSYNSMFYTCSQAHALIDHEGAVILGHNGRNNLPIYDRFISESGLCDLGFYANRTYIPTKDSKSCPVNNCAPASHDRDR